MPKKTKTILNLTAAEQGVINHRLVEPDTIAEVFSETYMDNGQEFPWHPEDVADVCAAICAGNLDEANDISEKLTRECLIEAIEGSTWAVDAYNNEPSPQKLAGTYRIAESAAKKIAEYTGKDDLVIPLE